VILKSEEDMQLKEKLELLFERLKDHDQAQRIYALSEIKKEVAGATQSMTSVPKPLKFLSKHYTGLKEIYHATPSSDFKVRVIQCMLTKYL
jgi:26S proteasome regulatory subunit N1